MSDNFPIEFIQWYTGDFPETIRQCYETWVRIKDDPDFGKWDDDDTKPAQLIENE